MCPIIRMAAIGQLITNQSISACRIEDRTNTAVPPPGSMRRSHLRDEEPRPQPGLTDPEYIDMLISQKPDSLDLLHTFLLAVQFTYWPKLRGERPSATIWLIYLPLNLFYLTRRCWYLSIGSGNQFISSWWYYLQIDNTTLVYKWQCNCRRNRKIPYIFFSAVDKYFKMYFMLNVIIDPFALILNLFTGKRVELKFLYFFNWSHCIPPLFASWLLSSYSRSCYFALYMLYFYYLIWYS